MPIIDFRAPLPALGTDAAALIHENIGIVMTYAFSREPLKRFRSRYLGEWRFLDYAISELPQRRANRACIELAVMLRALDETQNLRSFRSLEFGKLYDKTGASKPLLFRDACNKIIHAKSVEWNFSEPDVPIIVCEAPQEQIDRYNWTKAEIRIDSLGGACGSLGS
jgi:hypothetical protein